ncbi:hypothetical protein FIBSPDRAFT_884051 [Athelia psychrophila]|uniref:Uncharacterized protein n=1 Tax=Athelia psychrophila TaxID=1759441 RepID=A0A166TDJ6_9AGAM|nr:hypothetical protein FIBSPDRAFT_884051 [Fibularhizoctonia sp. CBS 109695]
MAIAPWSLRKCVREDFPGPQEVGGILELAVPILESWDPQPPQTTDTCSAFKQRRIQGDAESKPQLATIAQCSDEMLQAAQYFIEVTLKLGPAEIASERSGTPSAARWLRSDVGRRGREDEAISPDRPGGSALRSECDHRTKEKKPPAMSPPAGSKKMLVSIWNAKRRPLVSHVVDTQVVLNQGDFSPFIDPDQHAVVVFVDVGVLEAFTVVVAKVQSRQGSILPIWPV